MMKQKRMMEAEADDGGGSAGWKRMMKAEAENINGIHRMEQN